MQELWKKVMGTGNNPSNFTDSLKNPVELVNWYACIMRSTIVLVCVWCRVSDEKKCTS